MMPPTGTDSKKAYWVLFIPSLPVLFFFLHNSVNFSQLVFTGDVARIFFFYIAAAYMIFILFRLLFRQTDLQAAMITALLSICFLFFGVLQDEFYTSPKFHFLGNTFILSFLLFSVTIFLFLFFRKKKILYRIDLYLACVFSLLILIEGSVLAWKMASGNNALSQIKKMKTPMELTAGTAVERPDIYHITFDSYTNNACLRKFWNYENEISDWLRQKGFYVADSAKSNYIRTPYSLASIFNMQYLNNAEPYLYSNSPNFILGARVYADNELYKFLKAEGYNLSTYTQLENEETATALGDLGITKPSIWLRRQTMERIYLSPWMQRQMILLFSDKQDIPETLIESMNAYHQYNVKALDHIMKDCSSKHTAPLFSFTHFMIPHDPYLVDENGIRKPSATFENADMEGYLGQVKYCNKLMKQITECVLADTMHKKIIIFHGDHGYRLYSNATNADQFGAWEAYYFPGGNYSHVPGDENLVNLYRKVLNRFFGFRMEMLPYQYFNYKSN